MYSPAASFGPEVAAHYATHLRGDEEAVVQFLGALAKGRRALEFAIGAGRIALPLAVTGIPVDGIELSPHMVEQLRGRPGGAQLDVVLGDMSVATTGRRYALVYLVYNTIFNLLTADDQIRCFANAAHHLAEEGRFVVEAAVPHAWIPGGHADYVHVEEIDQDGVVLDVARYDAVTQLLEENHVRISTTGITTAPIVCRLITPGEMDLMARIAGLRLVERVATWQRTPFNTQSTAHVSVYALRDPP